MSARREYEMFFKLTGGLSGEFSSSFRNASTQMKSLQTAMQRTNSVLKDISAYKRQQQAIERQNETIQASEARLQRLQERHRELQEEMANTQNPSERLRSQLRRNEEQIQSCADSIDRQNTRLQEMQSELDQSRQSLQDAGVDTDNLTQSTEEYQRRLERLSNTKNFLSNVTEELDTATQKFKDSAKELGELAAGIAGVVAGVYAGVSKPAMDFESAFTGVRKTVDATEEEFADLRKGILDMSQNDVTASASEIAAVAENAGQLGIETDNILSFSKAMIDLGESTNLSSDEAASSLAKFANVTGMSQKKFYNLGSTIVDLGNHFATTESDIVEMGTRLASTGTLTGLSEPQIMAAATALSSLGIEAEAGGSAMSKILKQLQVATETGKGLDSFAEIANMSGDDFKKLFKEDALKALSAFTSGLNDTERNGKSAVAILDDMGIKEVRMSNAVLSLASSDDLLTRASEMATEAWEDNTALAEEAEKRYATTESQMDMTKNSIENLRIELGDMTLPVVRDAAEKATELAKGAQRWVSENKDLIADMASMAVEAAKYLLVLKGSKVVYYGVKTGVLGAVSAFTKFKVAILAAQAAGKGKGFKTFLSTITGLSGAGAAGAVVGGIAAAAVILGGILLIDHQRIMAIRKELVDNDLFGNGKKSLKEYTDELKDATSENYKYAQEINNAADELDNIEYEMGKVRSSVDLYNQILEENGTLTSEQAEAMYEPFNELVSKLEEDFSMRYNLVFDAFKKAAVDVSDQLGVSITEISGTLESFKARFSDSTSESQKVINDLLDKQKNGDELTDEDYAQYREEMGYITEMSEAAPNSNLTKFNAEAATLQGWDFGANQEEGIENLNALYEYGKGYIDELDAAQENLNSEYDTLRNQAKIMLEHGKIDKKEYDDTMKALDEAQKITYQSYREKRDDFTDEFDKLYDTFISQIDQAITNAVATTPRSLWESLGGTFSSYGEQYGNLFTGKGSTYDDGDLFLGSAANKKANESAVANMKNEYSGTYDAAEQFKPGSLGEGVKLPGYASGTDNTPSAFIAGENGPELITGAPGRTVFTADQTAAIFGVLPQALSVMSSARQRVPASVSITINSNPSVTPGFDVESYNADLAEKVRSVIAEMIEDERRNAF